MQNRRKFLQFTATAAAGGMLFSNKVLAGIPALAARPLGVQLFTFFTSIDEDVTGTLKKVAAIGFTEIESAFSKKGGYYGMKPKAFAKQLNDMGMSWKSHHVLGAPFKLPPDAKMPVGPDGKPITIPPMRNLQDNMQQLVDEAAEAGVKYLVCANTPITTLAEVKQSAAVLAKTHEACQKAGIGFAFHNHDAEFKPVEGKIPYDIFLTETPVKMELDVAWAVKAGKDPVEIFKQNPGRFPLWHLKDLDATHQNILPVGEGTVDYKKVFEAAGIAGLQHCFVEHDMPKDAFDSIKTSFTYLTNLFKTV
ncbi:MAG: hypothetical protein RL172_3092 [Bacteroidota bacterium]|jgi:sugar phosphate isomerase/epimerase